MERIRHVGAVREGTTDELLVQDVGLLGYMLLIMVSGARYQESPRRQGAKALISATRPCSTRREALVRASPRLGQPCKWGPHPEIEKQAGLVLTFQVPTSAGSAANNLAIEN